MDAQVLRDLENKIPYSYVMGPDRRPYVVQGEIAFADDTGYVAARKGQSDFQFPVEEAGRLKYDPKADMPVEFVPDYKPIDLLPSEEAEIQRNLDNAMPSFSRRQLFRRAQANSETKVLECARIREQQRAGKTFLQDKIFVDNAQTLLTIRLGHPGRISAGLGLPTDPELSAEKVMYERAMFHADMTGTNERTLLKAVTSKFMITNQWKWYARYPTKLGLESAVGQPIQLVTYKLFLKGIPQDTQAKKDNSRVADFITEWNYIWMTPSMAKSDAMDKYVIMRWFPDLAYKFCVVGSGLRIIASPKGMRFIEGTATGWGYQWFRDKYVRSRMRSEGIPQQE